MILILRACSQDSELQTQSLMDGEFPSTKDESTSCWELIYTVYKISGNQEQIAIQFQDDKAKENKDQNTRNKSNNNPGKIFLVESKRHPGTYCKKIQIVK